jgi:signal transduction histidine kinase
LSSAIKRLESYLAGDNLADWRAFALTQPLFFTFGWITFYGHSLSGLWQVAWLVASSVLLEPILVFAFRPLLAPRNRKSSIWRIWMLYWLAGELSGFFDIITLNIPFRDPAEGVSAWSLILTNGLLRVVWFTVAHLAVSVLRSDFRLLSELSHKSDELSRLQAQVNDQLARELGGLREAIAEKIAAALLLISKQVDGLSASTPKSELLARAAKVSELCDTEVRALSHEISERHFEPDYTAGAAEKLPRMIWGLPVKAEDIQLHWQWVAGIGVLNAFAIALEHGGWIGAVSALLAIVVGIPLLRGLDSLRKSRFATESSAIAIVQVALEYILISGLVLAGLWLLGTYVPEIRKYVQTIYLIVPIVILIIWALVQIIIEYTRRLRQHGNDLSLQNQLLAQAVSVAQARAAKARNRIGKLLHGTTQGRLASVSLAIAAAASAEATERLELLLNQAREQLARAENDLVTTFHDVEGQSTLSLDDEMQQLVEGWRNLVSIRHHVSRAAIQILEARPKLLPAVVEAMQECVTNSVRHGKASAISINIDMEGANEQELVLEVSNDGDPVSEIMPGFGIRAIYESARDIQIENRGELTFVTIRWDYEALGLAH